MEENFSPEHYLTDRSLLEKTLAQTEKDFLSAGIELDLHHENVSFESTCKLLEEKIQEITRRQINSINNLLYRIDIPESRIRSLHTITGEKSFELMIAELIIKRELQKVVIREYYKKNNKDEE